MNHLMNWFFLLVVLVGCASSRTAIPQPEKTPGISPGMMEILRAEDTRNPHALLQMAASLNFDRPDLAQRLAIASGRVPCFQTWQLLAAQFGKYENVARALAIAARFPETKFPAEDVLRGLLELTPSEEVVETLMYLDLDQAFQAAVSMKPFQRTLAANLWRQKSRVDRAMLNACLERYPEESVVSIARLGINGLINAKQLERLPWPLRQQGCPVCSDPDHFLSDPAWQVRVSALRKARSVDVVRPLLQDQSALVRLEALRAMLRLDPQWQPQDIESLHPWEAEALAAAPRTPGETVKRLFSRGKAYAEVTAPHMPAEARTAILAAGVSDRAIIRFLENRFGEVAAIAEAAQKFRDTDSAYALEYLLSRKQGVDQKAVAEEAAGRGKFTSVLADFGFPPPEPIPTGPDHYATAINLLSKYHRFLIHTSKGTLEGRFFTGQAPLTCASFMKLALNGFFDGLTIHRVVPGFVTQDGDPSGSGSGGPGYTLRCEYNELTYDRAGRVGMALAGKDTGGSQYFITHAPAPHLNHRYTVFAQVEKGLDLLSDLCQYDRIEKIELR